MRATNRELAARLPLPYHPYHPETTVQPLYCKKNNLFTFLKLRPDFVWWYFVELSSISCLLTKKIGPKGSRSSLCCSAILCNLPWKDKHVSHKNTENYGSKKCFKNYAIVLFHKTSDIKIVTVRIRRMTEGNMFSLFTPAGMWGTPIQLIGVPRPSQLGVPPSLMYSIHPDVGVTPSFPMGVGRCPCLADRGHPIWLMGGWYPIWLAGGTSTFPNGRYPHPSWWGVPHLAGQDSMGYPCQDCMGVSPFWLDGVPPFRTGWGTPQSGLDAGSPLPPLGLGGETPSPLRLDGVTPPHPIPSGDRAAERALLVYSNFNTTINRDKGKKNIRKTNRTEHSLTRIVIFFKNIGDVCDSVIVTRSQALHQWTQLIRHNAPAVIPRIPKKETTPSQYFHVIQSDIRKRLVAWYFNYLQLNCKSRGYVL